MKRILLVVLLAVISLGAYAQKGTQSVGFNIGYGFTSENATLGLDYRYNLTDAVRLSPSLSYFVKNDGLSAWNIDMNAHYVFPLSEMFGFYPLAGLNLSFWKFSCMLDDHSISQNETRFGANVGLGAELYATEQLTVGIEGKYTIIKDFDQALLAVRVAYNF